MKTLHTPHPWFLWCLGLPWFLSPAHAAMNASETLILQTGGTERVRINAQGVSLTGAISATAFEGDGSRLTNLPLGTLSPNTVNTHHIIDGAIRTADISTSAVTLPKIQNIATNRLLGRAAAGTGDVQQITIGSGLTLTGTTLSSNGDNVTCVPSLVWSAWGTCAQNPSAGACPANTMASANLGSDSSEDTCNPFSGPTRIRVRCLRITCN